MSTREQHSKEPWRHVFVDGGWDGVAEPGGAVICKLVLNEPANARRIVAAVNACKGIPTEALEIGVVGKLLGAVQRAERHLTRINGTSGWRDGEQQVLEHLRAVIAEAEGRDHA